jgi:AmmeMemoRadiSam system protein B
MDRPKVRFVNVQPIVHEGKELIMLADMEGITESPLVVSRDVLFLISLMDGTRTLRDLQEAYMRRFGSLIFMERLEEIIELLDKHLLLQNERFESHLQTLKERFEAESERRPFHAGKSYPAEREELLRYIRGFLSDHSTAEVGRLRGIFSPHIDYRRGGHVYGSVYGYLKGVEAQLIVILGTSHKPTDRLFSVSSKDFLTPLGRLTNLLSMRPELRAWSFFQVSMDEWPHRTEHSIELQLPFIQYFLGERQIQILPILVGAIEDSMWDSVEKKRIDAAIEGLREVLEASQTPYLVLSAVDLAHIGLQFGEEPVDEFRLLISRRKDEMLLGYMERVDPEGFFSLIREEKNERKVCGFSPLYVQLRLLQGCKGRIVKYEQWTDCMSSVSFASGIFYESQ